MNAGVDIRHLIRPDIIKMNRGKERVCLDLVDSWPLVWLQFLEMGVLSRQRALHLLLNADYAHKDVLQQITSFRIKLVWVLVLGMQHFLKGEVLGRPSKRWPAGDELEKHAAERPDIRAARTN